MPTAKPPARTVAKRAVPRKTTPTPSPAKPASPVPSAAKSAKSAKLVKMAKLPPQVKTVSTVKAAKPQKLRRKPVRDSFTMPEADFALIATLKACALSAKRETKKSELLRAGLHALAALDTRALIAALGALEPVKIGRPKSGS